MPTRRSSRAVHLRFDDGFRGGITMGIAVVLVLLTFALDTFGVLPLGHITMVLIACSGISGAFIVYLVWTHLAFSRLDPQRAAQIASRQARSEPSPVSRWLGGASTESWAISAAGAALMGAIAAAVFGAGEGGAILTAAALVTAAAAWMTVAYAFGLRYFRLHHGGDHFEFGIREAPQYSDFITMAVMISAAGAFAASAPATRTGLATVRTHTVVAFVFNALVVAMTVSLFSGLILALGER